MGDDYGTSGGVLLFALIGLVGFFFGSVWLAIHFHDLVGMTTGAAVLVQWVIAGVWLVAAEGRR